MTNKENLNGLFTSILGVKIDLVGDEPELNEQMFIEIIEKWEKAWTVQNTLLTQYGVLLEGYDGLLYDALDNLSICSNNSSLSSIEVALSAAFASSDFNSSSKCCFSFLILS
jgi:molybdenum cofactor biosynthesis enzyme MoaA